MTITRKLSANADHSAAKLAERDYTSAPFGAKRGALASASELKHDPEQCTEALVRHVDRAIACIWIPHDEATRVLLIRLTPNGREALTDPRSEP